MSKQTIARWLNGAEPEIATLFQIAKKFGIDAQWLGTGEGQIVAPPQENDLNQSEADLLARYRDADPRWQLSMRLLSYVATEDQSEVAADVNLVLARVFGKHPGQIRYISDERAAQAIGKAPHVVQRKVKERR